MGAHHTILTLVRRFSHFIYSDSDVWGKTSRSFSLLGNKSVPARRISLSLILGLSIASFGITVLRLRNFQPDRLAPYPTQLDVSLNHSSRNSGNHDSMLKFFNNTSSGGEPKVPNLWYKTRGRHIKNTAGEEV